MKWPVAVLCLAWAFRQAAADAEAPPAIDPSELIPTVLSDPAFWATENQTWDEESDQLCVFDPTGLGSRGLCKTNIGWYIKASGLDKATIDLPAMQFYLRFQMREACHGTTEPVPTGGRQCSALGVDWSRYPLSPTPHSFNTSDFCRTVYDDAEQPLGCANNYLENECCSVDSPEDWNEWYKCDPLPDTVDPGSRDQTKDECRQLLFEQKTGWNYTVLFRMNDLILQNGNDCQKWYEQKNIGTPSINWKTYCEAGDVPPPPIHPILTELAKPPPDGKLFFGSVEAPLEPKAMFAPPPPYSPPPPPNPPGVLPGVPATPGAIGTRPPGTPIPGTSGARSVVASVLAAVASLLALVLL